MFDKHWCWNKKGTLWTNFRIGFTTFFILILLGIFGLSRIFSQWNHFSTMSSFLWVLKERLQLGHRFSTEKRSKIIYWALCQKIPKKVSHTSFLARKGAWKGLKLCRRQQKISRYHVVPIGSTSWEKAWLAEKWFQRLRKPPHRRPGLWPLLDTARLKNQGHFKPS